MHKPICPYCKTDQKTRIQKIKVTSEGKILFYNYQVVCDGCASRGPKDMMKSTAVYYFQKG